MLILLTPITPTATVVAFHFSLFTGNTYEFSYSLLRPAMTLHMLPSVRSSTLVNEATTETINNLIWKYLREKRLVPHA